MPSTPRRVFGMFRVVVHLTRGATKMLLLFPLIGRERQRREIKRWAEGVLAIFGLDLVVEGTPPTPANGPRLLAGNHVSWVDIYAYLSVTEVTFVAKSEVRAWPLVGWLASRIGTIFVERDRPRDAVRVGNEVRAALADGTVVCVFPEGTTTDGTVVLPFSSVLLSPAIDTAAHVQPVSIAYHAPDGTLCDRAPFTGDATLVGSLWRLAGGGRSTVRLTFLEPIDGGSADRREIARRAEDAVRRSLGHDPAPPARDVASRARQGLSGAPAAALRRPSSA